MILKEKAAWEREIAKPGRRPRHFDENAYLSGNVTIIGGSSGIPRKDKGRKLIVQVKSTSILQYPNFVSNVGFICAKVRNTLFSLTSRILEFLLTLQTRSESVRFIRALRDPYRL